MKYANHNERDGQPPISTHRPSALFRYGTGHGAPSLSLVSCERGLVLPFGLLILLLLTLLGISGVTTSGLGQRVRSFEREIAHHSADGALRYLSELVMNGVAEDDLLHCQHGYYDHVTSCASCPPGECWKEALGLGALATIAVPWAIPANLPIPTLVDNPQGVIERLEPVGRRDTVIGRANGSAPRYRYQITVRGVGTGGAAQAPLAEVWLQSQVIGPGP